MLKLDALAYRHTGHTDDGYEFTMEDEAGKIAGITGRSGSGKSTLLDLIAGFLPPTSGVLNFDGTNLLPLPPEERPVTILFQNNNLFDHLTAEENIALGANTSLRLNDEQRAQVADALSAVGLEGLGHRRAGKLSGGEQQRVGLARALVRNTPVLLLDEPFSALDTTTRRSMLELVRKIADEHLRAIVMVTHDVRDCEAIADKHYLLFEGRLHLQE
ncbi:MAG: thiamine ABC transporter ATP-binding protein [Hyphomicrobiales bacterium]